MRPGKGNADDGDGKGRRSRDVHDGQPPARQHKPDDVADGWGRQRLCVEVMGLWVSKRTKSWSFTN